LKIPCFDCVRSLLRNQKECARLHTRKIHSPMIQRAGRRCRNELRHASCSYFEDFRFAGQHAQRGENHTSRRAPKGANVSHEHKSCGQHKHLHDTRDDEDRGGAIDEDFSSPPPHDSMSTMTDIIHPSLPHTQPEDVIRIWSSEAETDMTVLHGVVHLQTVFQGHCPGHLPVHSSCNGLIFVLPSTLSKHDGRASQIQGEIAFTLDARRPVYLHLLKADDSFYFVCSAHTAPGSALPHRIPGTASVTMDPDCRHMCTCWRALLLYFAGLRHMVPTCSTHNELISQLESSSDPWILRKDCASTSLGSPTRNVWTPQHTSHVFDVCMVCHKLAHHVPKDIGEERNQRL